MTKEMRFSQLNNAVEMETKGGFADREKTNLQTGHKLVAWSQYVVFGMGGTSEYQR